MMAVLVSGCSFSWDPDPYWDEGYARGEYYEGILVSADHCGLFETAGGEILALGGRPGWCGNEGAIYWVRVVPMDYWTQECGGRSVEVVEMGLLDVAFATPPPPPPPLPVAYNPKRNPSPPAYKDAHRDSRPGTPRKPRVRPREPQPKKDTADVRKKPRRKK